jgi:pachytene checkpoint protein 2
MEEKGEAAIRPFGGDYVVVDKQDASSKRGVLFVEARIRDDVMKDPQLEVGVSEVRIVLLICVM